MRLFDDFKNLFDSNGNIRSNVWVEWQHEITPQGHCGICLVLDKCWFDNNIMPLMPQHPMCHCTKKYISPPIANVTSKGNCDINKFIGYIFSDKYAWNGKRDLFESLGFSIEDSQYLKKEFERQAVEKYCNSQYVLGKLDENGQRINIDISFQKADRSITFVSGWMIRPQGYITCNTPLGG